MENLPRLERKILLLEVLENHGQNLALGAVVIATKQKIRIRWKLSAIANLLLPINEIAIVEGTRTNKLPPQTN